MKTIQKIQLRTLALVLLLSTASAYPMLNQATLKLLSKVGSGTAIVGLSFVGNIGANYYKGLKSISETPLVDINATSISTHIPIETITPEATTIIHNYYAPENQLVASASNFAEPNKGFIRQCFNGTCSLVTSTVKFIGSSAVNFAIANPQMAFALGSAALGYIVYKGKVMWDLSVLKKGMEDTKNGIKNLEAGTKKIIADMAILNAELTAAIKNGNHEIIEKLTAKIEMAKDQLIEKIALTESSIAHLSSKTDAYHMATTAALTDTKKAIERLNGESSQKLDEVNATLNKNTRALEEIKSLLGTKKSLIYRPFVFHKA